MATSIIIHDIVTSVGYLLETSFPRIHAIWTAHTLSNFIWFNQVIFLSSDGFLAITQVNTSSSQGWSRKFSHIPLSHDHVSSFRLEYIETTMYRRSGGCVLKFGWTQGNWAILERVLHYTFYQKCWMWNAGPETFQQTTLFFYVHDNSSCKFRESELSY